jgi:hypothetical protein
MRMKANWMKNIVFSKLRVRHLMQNQKHLSLKQKVSQDLHESRVG